MTRKKASNQDKRRARAVWFARSPARTELQLQSHAERRLTAALLARTHRARIVGEFLLGGHDATTVSSQVWNEVIDLLWFLRAGALVVLDPREIATDAGERAARIAELDDVGVHLIGIDAVGEAEVA